MPKSFIQLEDGKMAYLAVGKGKDLILLHSLNISAESWEKVFRGLTQNFTVHALDMFGHEGPPLLLQAAREEGRPIVLGHPASVHGCIPRSGASHFRRLRTALKWSDLAVPTEI